MPLTMMSGSPSSSPRVPKRTQSTGVPSVAKAVEPSASRTSSTWSGWWMVIPRPMALRLESGAMTLTRPRGSSACLSASNPGEWTPSSFVTRMWVTGLQG